ncbi:MAG: ABC transporter ATP-binding protein [Lachnospiraceae bacterium]|nr:ABC transporter ATP-binding protein [Lachnospiraceae bacterium]
MNLLKKIIRKIKEGMLQEIFQELLWIYHYGLRYKMEILWYIFLGIFSTGMSLGGSVISKYIIDAVTGFDSKGLAPAAVFYILMQLMRIGSNAWTRRISTRIEIKVDQEIRADVYDKIMEADWEAMSEYHSGDLLNRVDNDVSSISSSVLGWVPDFVTQLVQFLGTLGIIIYYDPTLAGLALLSAPVTLVVSRVLMKKMRDYNKKMREASSEVMMFNEESFQNVQVIKSFGLTGLYGRKLRQVQARYREIRLDYNKFSILTSSFMSLVGTVVTVVCFGWGVYRLWTGHITYGTMTLFLEMSDSLSASFSSLVYMVPSAISAATAAGRIMAVAELPKENREGEEQVEQLLEENRKGGVSVETEQMAFGYAGGKMVFEHVDFLAAPGEIVALVGPSGEGKTTMLRVILGIVNVKAGSARVFGRDTQQKIPISAATRRLFAYVPQGNTMFAGTVAENLRMMKQDASNEELYEVLKLACAYDFIVRLPDGLNSRIRERGGGFSEGQIQRLSIARALLADVPVLLLDEATSALDVATERKVLRNIMQSEKNRTCIVTTHRPSVLGICSRVYRIEGGSMTCVGEEEVQKMMMDF